MFLDAASSRRPVMASSRATMTTTIHAADLHRRVGMQMRAFHEGDERRAGHDLVRQRVHEDAEIGDQIAGAGDAAIQKIRHARETEKNQRQRVAVGELRQNIAHRKSTVSPKRETVSLLGRFIWIYDLTIGNFRQ